MLGKLNEKKAELEARKAALLSEVKKVENIVFQAKEAKKLTSSDADIDSLIVELLSNHTIG